MDFLNGTCLYRLRLLADRDRFYKAGDATLNTLARRGLIARTDQLDRFGREEWTITAAGQRAALVKAMPPEQENAQA
jgi:hypothetical protein